MKKTDIHTFIKKYNSELSIKGYSKMKKADLVRVVESTLKRSRQEIKDEWSSMKQGSFATKSGAKRSNTATKTGSKRVEVATKSGMTAAKRAMMVKRISDRRGGLEGARRALESKRVVTKVDDDITINRRRNRKRSTTNKSGARPFPKMSAKLVVAPGAQMDHLNRATSRIETKAKSGYYDMPFNKSTAARKKGITRDTALARRIRGR
jgi:hypothetical protein